MIREEEARIAQLPDSRALGYKPDRTVPYRILNRLARDGKLRAASRGEGRKLARDCRSG